MGPMIGGRPESELLRVVEREIRKKTNQSKLLPKSNTGANGQEARDEIVKFELSELTVGQELGRGGFCVVKELSRINLSTEKEIKTSAVADVKANSLGEHTNGGIDTGSTTQGNSAIVKTNGEDEPLVQNRQYMAENCTSGGRQGQCRYVIKMIQDSARKDPGSFVRSVIDLALEAKFLHVLQHPNIITMRATASTSPYKEGLSFFIVLDRLSDLLSRRLQAWKKQQPMFLFSCCEHTQNKGNFWVERLTVAHGVADALSFLHAKNVVYRDIKPDNVGFDIMGRVKVFDFGLAREMQKKLRTVEGTYHFTGGTGFPPYMAPEVALDKPYNETSDCYSFAILLWYILKMDVPFGRILTDHEFMMEVVHGGLRPQLDNRWPDEILEPMKLSWLDDIRARPTMESIKNILFQQIYEA